MFINRNRITMIVTTVSYLFLFINWRDSDGDLYVKTIYVSAFKRFNEFVNISRRINNKYER